MKRSKYKIPELLAPAGNKEAFIAAVEAGADAVYCGGDRFNARMNAGNFTLEELANAVEFAHKRGVKVHVTLNILLRDEELAEALDYAANLWRIGADAIIVQDLGLAALIKKHIPEMEMHLSTQGTVYNMDGVLTASKLGFSRVVLARELSLHEIKRITTCLESQGKSKTEIEIFCHGALCYCYSGQCQMSRAIGGRSGNRGGCAQPCRMPYQGFDQEGNKLNSAYPLSPSDFELIDFIPEISAAGVASIKIEGRMKSPEYVATVTSIYRKYLDIYRETGQVKVSEKDRLSLFQIFNRGFTTSNFLSREDRLMSGESPKNKGLYIGKVSGVKKAPSKREERYLAQVKIDESAPGVKTLLNTWALSKGDLLEISDSKGLGRSNSATVTYINKQNGIIELGDFKEKPSVGETIYRLVSSEQIKEASHFFSNKDWSTGKYIRKLKLSATVVSDGSDFVGLTVKDPISGKGMTIRKDIEAEAAKSGELSDTTISRIKASLKKTGGTPYEIEDIQFRGNFDFSLSMSDINDLRRRTLEGLDTELSAKNRSEGNMAIPIVLRSAAPALSKGEIELFFYQMKTFVGFYNGGERHPINFLCDGSRVNAKYVIPAAELLMWRKDEEKWGRLKGILADEKGNISVYVSNVANGLEEEIVNANHELLTELCLEYNAGIYLGNIGEIEGLKVLREKGVKLLSDYGMNIYNQETAHILGDLGIYGHIDSLETDGVHFGALPLMTIGHHNNATTLIDRKGAEYNLINPDYTDNIILLKSMGENPRRDVKLAIDLAGKEKRRKRFYISKPEFY